MKEVKVEHVVLNKFGKRAIRLDAWGMTTDDRQIDMEMENSADRDSLPKRTRYYQGLLDTPILKSGKDTKYRELPSSIIIFITQDDIFEKDRAIYTFTEQCEEIPGLHLDDGTKKIFLNMTSKNGSKELVSMLQYMKNTTLENPDIEVRDARITELDRIVSEVKESEEWEEVQMNILEIGIAKGRTEGRAEAVIDILSGLGNVPEDLTKLILEQQDQDTLKDWLLLAVHSGSVEEFAGKIMK